jgi:DNA-binding transcriptional LysR family regulator
MVRIDAYLSDRRATLEHLRSFVAVVEDGGFANASKNLHRTQSAVTQNLQKLEQIVGCKLLERKQGRVVGLTSEGERFLPQVKEILSKVSNAIGALQKAPMAGRIRLGVPDDFNVADIQSALSCCLEMNPHLRVEVRSALSGTIHSLVKANELDVAIFRTTECYDQSREITMKSVAKEKLHWVGRENILFSNMQEIPLVLFPDGCAYRKSALQVLAAVNKPYRLSYSSSSYENIRGAIYAGLGFGVVPESAVESGYVVLRQNDGFPALPDTELLVAIRSGKSIYQEFSEYLLRSSVDTGTILPKSGV